MAVFRSDSGSFKSLLITGSGLILESSSIYFKNLTSSSTSNVLTYNNTTGQIYYTASSAIGGGGSGPGVTINNNTDNYLITATGTANTLNGEANLQFDGSTLTLSGSLINNISFQNLDTLLSRAYNNAEVGSYSGEVLSYQSGKFGFDIDTNNPPSLGDLLYLNTDGIWYLVDQTSNSSTKKLGFYIQNINTSNYGILIDGYMVLNENEILSYGYGESIFITGSAPVTFTTVPNDITGPGYIRNIGHLHYNNNSTYPGWWVLRFKPSNDWTEII